MRLPCLLPLLAGCGASLLGPVGLRALDDLEAPRHLAWELRAYAAPGVHAPCTLYPVPEDQVGLEGLPFGELDILAPEPDPPGALREGAGYRWSLSIPVAVARDGPEVSSRPARSDTPLSDGWGASPDAAWLVVEGDAAAASRAFGVEVVQGGQWLGLLDSAGLLYGEPELDLVDDGLGARPWLLVLELEDLPQPLVGFLRGDEGADFPECGG